MSVEPTYSVTFAMCKISNHHSFQSLVLVLPVERRPAFFLLEYSKILLKPNCKYCFLSKLCLETLFSYRFSRKNELVGKEYFGEHSFYFLKEFTCPNQIAGPYVVF